MPVPSLITDLSTTAASNSPAGAESARGTIDDYLRAHASFIAQTRAGTSATTYTYSATGARIQGDFSNATQTSRTAFQSSTTNGVTSISALPNGSATAAGYNAYNAADPTNSAYVGFDISSTLAKLTSSAIGSGTALPLTFNVGAGGPEVARFTTTGNFGINTTAPATKLDVLGPASVTSFTGSTRLGVTVRGSTAVTDYSGIDFIGSSSSNPTARIAVLSTATGSSLRFGTSDNYVTGITNTAMMLNQAGQVLVGTDNGSSTAGSGVKITPDTIAPYVATVGSDSSGSNGSYYLYSTSAPGYRFYVLYNGSIHAVSTTITSISDARLKENVRDLDAGLTKIMALKPRRFDWKTGKGKDKKDDWGWIAQEFEQTFPEMIHEWKDPAPEGEEPYKAVNADLIPVLVKAIQEQQALIVSLEARVAALEAA